MKKAAASALLPERMRRITILGFFSINLAASFTLTVFFTILYLRSIY